MNRKDVLIDKFINEIQEKELRSGTFKSGDTIKELQRLKDTPHDVYLDVPTYNKVFRDFKVEDYFDNMLGKTVSYQKKSINVDEGPVAMYVKDRTCTVIFLDFKKHEVLAKNLPMSKYYEYMASIEKKRENPDDVIEDVDFSTDDLDYHDFFANAKKKKQAARSNKGMMNSFDGLNDDTIDELFGLD